MNAQQQQEILDILQEECAEVIQMISKCRRFGLDNTHLKLEKPNRECLTEEIGDLMCLVNLAIVTNIVSIESVQTAQNNKLEKLKTWSNIFKETT